MSAITRLRREPLNTGGTDTARYCYSVWLRHLIIARQRGLDELPKTVLELGPGDSIGIGLAALLSGANTYYALDAFRYANIERSLTVFDDLVGLFQRQESIPRDREAAEVEPKLPSYDFPLNLLQPERLTVFLAPERLDMIRRAIEKMNDPPSDPTHHIQLSYIAPWDQGATIPSGSVDLIYSQAVLEHVKDLRTSYGEMYNWCRPGGCLSHQIDLRSHGTSLDWNGQWQYSEAQWKRVENPQTYRYINRQPSSEHIKLIQESGFDILTAIRGEDYSGIDRNNLASQWQRMADEDITCYSLHVVACKPL